MGDHRSNPEPQPAVPPSGGGIGLSARAEQARDDFLTDRAVGLDLTQTATRLVAELEEEGSRLLAENPPTAPLACTAGCAWCCRQGVDVTVAEASLIAQHLETAFPPAVKDVLVAKVADVADRGADMTPLERQKAAIPCAFLGNDGSCSIYAVRPLLCRATLATDADRCRRAFVGGEIGVEDTLKEPRALAAALVMGTAEGFRIANGGQGVYELHALLAAVYRRAGS